MTKKNLPTSFKKMVLTGDNFFTVEEVEHKIQIPKNIASAYISCQEFFRWLRDSRDKIAHCGKSFEFILINDNGFLVTTNKEPFNSLNIWNDNNTAPKDLGSLKSFVSYIICPQYTTIFHDVFNPR